MSEHCEGEMTEEKDESEDILLATLIKNDTCEVRLLMRSFRGRWYLSLREFFVAYSGDWCPTRRGVTLRREWFADVRAALDDFERRADGQDAANHG